MRIVSKAREVRWGTGSVADRPANFMTGTWLVTNPMTDSKTDLVVVGASLRLPLLKRLRLDRESSTLDSPLTVKVPWGATREFFGSFWVVLDLRKPGRGLPREASCHRSIREQAAYNGALRRAARVPNEAGTRPRAAQCNLRSGGRKASLRPYKRLLRYGTNGRREGGLGSTVATYAGKVLRGFGAGIREVGCQEIS